MTKDGKKKSSRNPTKPDDPPASNLRSSQKTPEVSRPRRPAPPTPSKASTESDHHILPHKATPRPQTTGFTEFYNVDHYITHSVSRERERQRIIIPETPQPPQVSNLAT